MNPKSTAQQFNKLLSPNLQKKPVLQLTAKKLPILQMTTAPNRPVKGATNLRLASKGSKNA